MQKIKENLMPFKFLPTTLNGWLEYLKSLPVQLIFIFCFAIFFVDSLNLTTIRFFYSISSAFIEVLIFFLPIIIFIFIFCSIVVLDRKSPIMVLAILLFVTASNMLALSTSYAVGLYFLPKFNMCALSDFAAKTQASIEPIFTLQLPKILGTDKAMLLGILIGLVVVFFAKAEKQQIIKEKGIFLRDFTTLILKNSFIPLLPFYLLGFSLKMSFEGSLKFLVQNYFHVFLLSCALLFVYLVFIYLLASKFNLTKFFEFIKNMLPAGLTGLSTMSSAASMPVTLKATEQNLKNKQFAQLIIPSTTNIHMLGDDLTIILTAMTLMLMKGVPLPDLAVFLPFAGAFCLAKLSCVGIPGASVLVVLPVLEQFLGFGPEMISMLTTIYVLQDSIGTFSNVMGNGALAIIIKNVMEKFKFFSAETRQEK